MNRNSILQIQDSRLQAQGTRLKDEVAESHPLQSVVIALR
jgi:hypothetical protein